MINTAIIVISLILIVLLLATKNYLWLFNAVIGARDLNAVIELSEAIASSNSHVIRVLRFNGQIISLPRFTLIKFTKEQFCLDGKEGLIKVEVKNGKCRGMVLWLGVVKDTIGLRKIITGVNQEKL